MFLLFGKLELFAINKAWIKLSLGGKNFILCVLRCGISV